MYTEYDLNAKTERNWEMLYEECIRKWKIAYLCLLVYSISFFIFWEKMEAESGFGKQNEDVQSKYQ